jgi:long-subunit acyl-CoA synthetase (AMP-forming)
MADSDQFPRGTGGMHSDQALGLTILYTSAKLAADPDPDNRAMVERAMAAGLAWVEAQEVGGTMTPEIEAAYRRADAEILGFLRALLGLDRVAWAGSAAAPMPLDVARFMAGLGLKVYDVYGMTETAGAVTANGPGGFKLGTVGRANPGMEVRLGDAGEVLVRGPVNTPGSFELLPVEWTAESEELTPTLELKRRVVRRKYADIVDRLYG